MANGRFLSRTIGSSEQLARLSWGAELVFYRMIPFLDVEGRLEGDPRMVKATCAPLKDSLTIEVIAAALRELTESTDGAGVPLVRWYTIPSGKQVIECPGFGASQQGLHKKREAPSRLPPYTLTSQVVTATKEEVRTNSGVDPEGVRTNSGVGPGPDQVRSRSGLTPDKGKGREGEVEVEVKARTTTALVESPNRGDSTTENAELEVGTKAGVTRRPVRGRLLGMQVEQATGLVRTLLEEAASYATADDRRDLAAWVIFSYWGTLFKHPHARMDRKRLNAIVRRLDESKDDASFLLFALKGAHKDEWITGRSGNSTKKYDGIETIFRDFAQVERFAERAGWKPGAVHPIAKRYLSNGGATA